MQDVKRCKCCGFWLENVYKDGRIINHWCGKCGSLDMAVVKLIEDNDPIARTKDLLEEWGKVQMFNAWKELGYKPPGYIIRKGGITPAISEDEVRVVDSLMCRLFEENCKAWQALKLYYTKKPDIDGNWTQERVARSMRCRKELAAQFIDQGVFYINYYYSDRAKELGVYR